MSDIKWKLCFILYILTWLMRSANANETDLYGMNYNWNSINHEAISHCTPSDRSAVVRGNAFLVDYNHPEVRGVVLQALRQMHDAGFGVLRLLVSYGKATQIGHDAFAIEKPGLAAQNLNEFASDAKKAGFVSLYIAFGAVGDLSPTCRREQYGDCFDSSDIGKLIQFVISVRSGMTAKNGDFLVVDLQNEGGLTRFHPVNLRQNMKAFISQLAKAYKANFPGDRTTVSIQDKFVDERLSFVLSAYKMAGLRPDVIDVHIYHLTEDSLSSIHRLLKKGNIDRIPVTIGEMPYEHPDGIKLAQRIFDDQPVLTIILWPLRVTDGLCGVDTGPPYSLDWIK